MSLHCSNFTQKGIRSIRILIAIDASRGSSYVVDEAAARPWPAGTEFSVIHVVDEAHLAGYPQLVDHQKQEGEWLVKTAADLLSRAGHKTHAEVLSGAPRRRISDFAKQWQADLVMVGSHGGGLLSRSLLGSVALSTLRMAPCSVEIVRPSASGKPASSHPMKILLATDGSEFSTAAAKFVANRPWPSGSQIRILSVEELPVSQYPADGSSLSQVYPASLLQELLDNASERAKESAETARKILVSAGHKPLESQPSPVGNARVLILDLAKEWAADLIVVGSHGRRGLDRLIMGSVSESVALYAHCSVEVVRP
ncbi:MAG: universal stress protein [Candidatus Acidiferrum sp.]